jgi:23S rRNA (guanosine2251-2'-O)-methyltransferase
MSATLALALDNIRSLYNVGAIVRSAAAFGVKHIEACGVTPYPEIASDRRLPHVRAKATAGIAKTALGAEALVNFHHSSKTTQAVATFRRQGYAIYLLEQSASASDLGSFKPRLPCLLVLGSEVNGVDPRLFKIADGLIEIPLAGDKESLNVAVAAGIALYQLTSPHHN